MAPTPPRLQYTSIRARMVDGQVLVGLKITAKDEAGDQVKLPWIEMPPEDVARLMDKLREVLADDVLKKLASRPAQ